MAVILHHAEDRDAEPHFPQHAFRHRRMGLAAVDEQGIGQAGELLIPLLRSSETAQQHLMHGTIVIGCAADGFDLELSIFAFRKASVF